MFTTKDKELLHEGLDTLIERIESREGKLKNIGEVSLYLYAFERGDSMEGIKESTVIMKLKSPDKDGYTFTPDWR